MRPKRLSSDLLHRHKLCRLLSRGFQQGDAWAPWTGSECSRPCVLCQHPFPASSCENACRNVLGWKTQRGGGSSQQLDLRCFPCSVATRTVISTSPWSSQVAIVSSTAVQSLTSCGNSTPTGSSRMKHSSPL